MSQANFTQIKAKVQGNLSQRGVSPYSQEFEDMRKDPIVRFAREGHIFFLKLLSVTVVKSLVTNGSRLEAKCFGFIFHSWL